MVEDVKLKKGMCRDEVNRLLKENDVDLELVDEIYGGNGFNHKWKCECGNIIEKRTWATVKGKGALRCVKCKYNNMKDKHKIEVEKDSEYKYINSYFKGDILPNGEIANAVYVEIRHEYCGSVYTIVASSFINENQRCGNCCRKYENSFAYYIEKELGEELDKYWDFEKNIVNPYYIWKNNTTNEIWIKCIKVEYHDSYKTIAHRFTQGYRCSYCHPTFNNKQNHPKDSFAQYHIDNTDNNFIEKYWSKKNKINPWKIRPRSEEKVWIKCQEKEYHDDYEISCDSFTRGRSCPYCNPRRLKNIHFKDSFGYNHLDKVLISWHSDNKISPFKIAQNTHKKYKFICHECGNVFKKQVVNITQRGDWCPVCSMSKGEKRIKKWLIDNDVTYIYDEEYFMELKGINDGVLRPDFILPKLNIWIEYNGEFHDGSLTNSYQTEEQYEKQQEHDRRKREYAKNNGYKLLEIWYWDFDNIEEILDREIGSLL
ncbi:TPA: hypothetical protein KRL47_001402 [Clostridioides difficile]|nr:hypothetical protein [Clostridioides difficile]HBH1338340.1 hypothetical protein [Clostridioides difficile]